MSQLFSGKDRTEGYADDDAEGAELCFASLRTLILLLYSDTVIVSRVGGLVTTV